MGIDRFRRDQAVALYDVMAESDPQVLNAFTVEDARRVLNGEKVKPRERIVKTVPLKSSVETERAPRVARLVEDRSYFHLLIGSKKAMAKGRRPPRHITICKEELNVIKQLFASVPDRRGERANQ